MVGNVIQLIQCSVFMRPMNEALRVFIDDFVIVYLDILVYCKAYE